jgi:hypothetical protein
VQRVRMVQSPTSDGGGSRFNIRYAENLPEEALTPESVMGALNRYLKFEDPAPGLVDQLEHDGVWAAGGMTPTRSAQASTPH